MSSDRMPVQLKDTVEFFVVSDIVSCKAKGKLTHLNFVNGRSVVSTKNLGVFEKALSDKNFIRVHHSTIVNINSIKMFHLGKITKITLADGSVVDVSLRKKSDFLKRIRAV